MKPQWNRGSVSLGVSVLVGFLVLGSVELASADDTGSGCFAIAGVHDSAGVDTTSVFLTGCALDELKNDRSTWLRCGRNHLHAPESWGRTHLHLPRFQEYGTSFAPYFWDASLDGRDDHPRNGPEGFPFVFYAGHGSPIGWRVQGGSTFLSQFSLGDVKTRYLWMVSCNALAHGPPASRGQNLATGEELCDYLNPGGFDASQSETGTSALDCKKHANAWLRWGQWYDGVRSPLNPRLRMVCGSSSQVTLDPNGSDRLWRHLLLERLPPAEAFLFGVAAGSQGSAPLCLARGQDRPWLSPLWDASFQLAPNSFTQSYLWMEYLVARPELVAELRSKASDWLQVESEPDASPPPPPSSMPVLAVEPFGQPWGSLDLGHPAQPSHERPFGFKARALAGWQPPMLPAAIDPADICIERHREGGSLILTWRPRQKPAVEFAALSPENLLPALAPLLQSGGAATPLPTPVLGTATARVFEVQLDGAPADKVVGETLAAGDIQRFTGCRFYIFRPEVQATADLSVPLLGAGSEEFWAICPPSRLEGFELATAELDPCLRKTPALLTVSLLTRKIESSAPQAQEMETFNLGEARAIATAFFPPGLDHADYDEVRYRWGYKAAPPHCRQTRFYIVYEFDYRPKSSAPGELVPLTIEVPAHKLCSPTTPESCRAAIEETWQCSPAMSD